MKLSLLWSAEALLNYHQPRSYRAQQALTVALNHYTKSEKYQESFRVLKILKKKAEVDANQWNLSAVCPFITLIAIKPTFSNRIFLGNLGCL